MTKKTLLPIGFEDWIFPQAGLAHDTLCKLVSCFRSYNYSLVTPPVIEFENSLIASNSRDTPKAQDMFRIIDPISHHTMALRGDITHQVIRLARDHLRQHTRPLRLCYYGNVFRIVGSSLQPNRQYTQIGIERIGESNEVIKQLHPLKNIREVLCIVLESLTEAGIQNLCLDFALPILLRDTFKQITDEAKQLLQARNIGGINQLINNGEINPYYGSILNFMLKIPPLDIDLAVVKIKKSPYFKKKDTLLSHLSNLYAQIRQSYPNVQMSLDVIEQNHFSDKVGIAFNIYVAGLNVIIGRGGEYIANQENACGTSLYLDSILSLLPESHDNLNHKKLVVPSDSDFSLIRAWRKKGWNIQFSDNIVNNDMYFWDGQKITKNKQYVSI